MKIQVLTYFRNKYVLTSILFCVYTLFLDEYDVFSLVSQNKRLNLIKQKEKEISQNLNTTKETLESLNNMENVEHYARSKKYFKKDNEAIFVISYE